MSYETDMRHYNAQSHKAAKIRDEHYDEMQFHKAMVEFCERVIDEGTLYNYRDYYEHKAEAEMKLEFHKKKVSFYDLMSAWCSSWMHHYKEKFEKDEEFYKNKGVK